MKRTNPALEMAALASSARACAPGRGGAITSIAGTPASNLKKRNGFMGDTTGVPARRQRLTT